MGGKLIFLWELGKASLRYIGWVGRNEVLKRKKFMKTL